MLSATMSRKIFGKSQIFIRQLVTDATNGSVSAPRYAVQRGTGISIQQRAALRASRKERAAKFLESQGVEGAKTNTSKGAPIIGSRMLFYLGLGFPTVVVTWGLMDAKSPPARFSEWIGLTGFIMSYIEEIKKPSHDSLLPDWSQVRFREQCLSILFFHFNLLSVCSILSLTIDTERST
jgi:hypothetical protein